MLLLYFIEIEREELKIKAELKKSAKKGETKACKILAKSILKSRHACERLLVAQTQINSICLNLKTQVGNCFFCSCCCCSSFSPF